MGHPSRITAMLAWAALLGCGRTDVGRRDAGHGDADGASRAPDLAGPDVGDARSEDSDGGPPGRKDVREGPEIGDAPWPDLPWERHPDRDVGLPPRGDAPDVADAGDARPFTCEALRALIAKGPLTDRHARQALFAPDGKSVLLLMIGEAGGDEVLLVSLPGGEQRVLATDATAAQWLGTEAVLVATVDASLRIVSKSGEILRTVPTKTCKHKATPDGELVYYVHDCERSSGTVSVLDVASGATRQLAASASISDLAVSPSGRWAAFLGYTAQADAAGRGSQAYVLERGGPPYAVSMPESGYGVAFISDEVLLIQSMSWDYLQVDLWRHRPGSSETVMLAIGDPGYPDYEAAADRSALLLARFPSAGVTRGELDVMAVADGTLVPVASDLMDYRMFEMRIRAFAIARTSQRIVYLADTSGDGGRSYSVVSVSRDGSDRVQIAANVRRAVVSPFGDRVAVFSDPSATGSKVIVASATTGATHVAIADATAVDAVTFVPGDRGLLFIDRNDATKSRRLRYVSFADGAITTVADWGTSKLLPYTEPTGILSSTYPVDPGGCFVPVDDDLFQVGTRLALLPAASSAP